MDSGRRGGCIINICTAGGESNGFRMSMGRPIVKTAFSFDHDRGNDLSGELWSCGGANRDMHERNIADRHSCVWLVLERTAQKYAG